MRREAVLAIPVSWLLHNGPNSLPRTAHSTNRSPAFCSLLHRRLSASWCRDQIDRRCCPVLGDATTSARALPRALPESTALISRGCHHSLPLLSLIPCRHISLIGARWYFLRWSAALVEALGFELSQSSGWCLRCELATMKSLYLVSIVLAAWTATAIAIAASTKDMHRLAKRATDQNPPACAVSRHDSLRPMVPISLIFVTGQLP